MSAFDHIENNFLQKAITAIEQNIDDENFGVSELADELNMSRSNLLRKVKSLTSLSASQFIRQVRLAEAKELLNQKLYTVSEISFKVGFGSTSYFIKCFRELYGYPPGEESKMKEASTPLAVHDLDIGMPVAWISLSAFLVICVVAIAFWTKNRSLPLDNLEKSIAVLPFKNDSADSSNLYIINGMMEAVLNDLQKIEDLRVISRTSVEKYRYQTKNIFEISEELDVNYFVEGSGQKVGDQILLTIQLIETSRDKRLWSQRYIRKVGDIFSLQSEVAKDIAGHIEAIITPEEQLRIEKIPTENLDAYDNYLRGIEYTKTNTLIGVDSAVAYFKKAINHDDLFAEAHAYIAICYYYSDLFQAEKKYSEEINVYADKAILLDANLSVSQIAKALYYMQNAQYELAVQYFEKALEFNPNSSEVSNFLSDIYTNYIPDTKKYLTYALRGVKLNVSSDSVAASFAYLHLSNALVQNGFIEEAETYINKSLEYNPDNIFSDYLYAYILLMKNDNLSQTKSMLINTYRKDTTRIDVLQEVAKTCYSMEDYSEALHYYSKFLSIKKALDLNIFESENLKIGFVLERLGRQDEAEAYYSQFKIFADNNRTIYRDLSLSAYYAAKGDVNKGISHLKKFSEQENYQIWFIFLKEDPIMRRLAEHPDFAPTLDKMADKFWKEHQTMRLKLTEEGLI